MANRSRRSHTVAKLRAALMGPQLLAFVPALSLSAYWFFGEGGLLIAALGLPIVWTLLGGWFSEDPNVGLYDAALQDMSAQERVEMQMAQVLERTQPNERGVVFAFAFDDVDGFELRHGQLVLDDIHDQVTRRLRSIVRKEDVVSLQGVLRWIVFLRPGERLDLETTIAQANRLQTVTDEPIHAGNTRLYFTASIGFTIARNVDALSPGELVKHAGQALTDAQHAGPASVRAYASSDGALSKEPEYKGTALVRASSEEIVNSITAYFQPQVSTRTGKVCGFEALARMEDPQRGTLTPASFLPVLEKAGRLEKLGEVMLKQALEALVNWDKAGLNVATVGVNFSAQDLSNPRLFDTISWELDRFAIEPHRLCIEVLESVIAMNSEDVIARNIMHLAKLGCQIDLDDFGTGHSSISTLRRLPVSRLKIDRSFVARADLDNEQQKMVATILMMADRLGLSTLAEGVETVGEHAIMSQLGCNYVQGYGIGWPMPFEDTVQWTNEYHAKLEMPTPLDRKSG